MTSFVRFFYLQIEAIDLYQWVIYIFEPSLQIFMIYDPERATKGCATPRNNDENYLDLRLTRACLGGCLQLKLK